MLLALGVPRVVLLTNNPDKAAQLGRLGITVTSVVATEVHLSPANAQYLATKATHGSHTLDLPPTDGLAHQTPPESEAG
jgi:GTP cyclohydrolase II